MTERYHAAALTALAAALFRRAGLDADKAQDTAEILVEGDLMGHTTHGLALLAAYLDAASVGQMAGTGEPEVLAATTVVETWDGCRLPGPWLVRRAAALAGRRAAEHGLAAVAIRRSTHIGCLAAYLRQAAEAGLMLIVTCSDPATASIAPFGGTRRVITPNPLAAGWPSPSGPVMIDVSMSITTNAMTRRKQAAGELFDHPWLLDAKGYPTRDPAAFSAGGSLLPLGGAEAGHKGWALGLLIEALTSALSGYGRADGETQWGANVLVLAIDPARFGGADAFLREAGWMEQAVQTNPPAPGGEPRLPGARALALRAEQLARGVALYPGIVPVLAARAAAAGLPMPGPV